MDANWGHFKIWFDFKPSQMVPTLSYIMPYCHIDVMEAPASLNEAFKKNKFVGLSNYEVLDRLDR